MKQQKPLFRVVKREGGQWYHLVLSYLLAVFIALAIGAVLLSMLRVPFITFYKNMFTLGMIGNRFPYKSIEGFVRLFVPLFITSVALSLAFRMRFWNIGGEGQFIMGAWCAGFVALKLGGGVPAPVMLLLMAAAGMIGGGLYGAVVAFLHVKFGTNETLLTLMLNYIAVYFITFFGETKGAWNFFLSPESARPRFEPFAENARMPLIKTGLGGGFSLNISLIFAILICVGVFLYLKYTKGGYEIAVVGDSPNSAHYAGMKVDKIVVRTIFISAAFIGLAGAFHASTAGVLSTSITNDVGWTGIVVAWLSKLNTIAIAGFAFFITLLQYGCQAASTAYPAVDANFADLIQGIILFSVLMADFFTRFRIVPREKTTKQEGKE